MKRDELEEGREQALVGIFKSRYLKRFESSVETFRISIRRALAFIKTFEEILLAGELRGKKVLLFTTTAIRIAFCTARWAATKQRSGGDPSAIRRSGASTAARTPTTGRS